MSVLEEIIAGVRADLASRKISMSQLQEKIDLIGVTRDPLPSLSSNEMSIIAEVKRSSPSKGILAAIVDPAGLAKIYEDAGATVVSVLTEERRFGGSLADLVAVRGKVSLPLLRKDFMVDEYQFFEARAYGADLILLIVAALSASQLRDFSQTTRELGMRALVEVHTEAELELAMEIAPEIVGVNSRNLRTLEVDPEVFARLIPMIPDSIVRVAESGISSRADVKYAQKCGATAVLVGEALVRDSDPASTMRALLGRE